MALLAFSGWKLAILMLIVFTAKDASCARIHAQGARMSTAVSDVGGTSSDTSLSAGAVPTMQTALDAVLPHMREVLEADASQSCGKCGAEKTPYCYAKTVSAETSEYQFTLESHRSECYLGARRTSRLYEDEEKFAAAIGSVTPVGAGGLSGAQHFLSPSKRFYLKSFGEEDFRALSTGQPAGDFLPKYVKHLEENPNTLLTHILAVFKVSIRKLASSSVVSHNIMVMDNGNFDIGDSDGKVQFDLKGSKWKHRLKADGGLRCSPLYPIEFFGSGPNRHEASGDDLDFYALRTQVSRSWYKDQETKIGNAQNSTWKDMLEARLKKYPLHDDCLMNQQWIKMKTDKAEAKGSTYDFCGKLDKQAKAKRDELGGRMSDATPADCRQALGGTETDGWKQWKKEEKAGMEDVREFYNIGTKPGREMETRPLIVEPSINEKIQTQIRADVELLRQSELMDYSMDLVIKHESQPVCSSRAATAADGRIFTQYKGGIRAVGRYGEEAEAAVYTIQILDFLAGYTSTKSWSEWAQSWVSENKIQKRFPEVLQELVGQVGVNKCKRVGVRDASNDPVLCWSSCPKDDMPPGWAPRCELPSGWLNSSSKWGHVQILALAEYDFKGFINNANQPGGNMDCDNLRRLCVVSPITSNKKEALEDKRLAALLQTPPSVPEPYRSQMTTQELDEIMRRKDVKKVLSEYFRRDVSFHAPDPLRRIAAMSYFNYAQAPLKEDTIHFDLYAERFVRFTSSWITSPTQEDWAKACPANTTGRSSSPAESAEAPPEAAAMVAPATSPFSNGASAQVPPVEPNGLGSQHGYLYTILSMAALIYI